MENYFLVHRWCPSDVPCSLYSEQELRTLHRTFGQPSVSALQVLLEKANGSKIEKNIAQTLEKMKEYCMVCEKTSTTPHEFKSTVSTSELRLNHREQADVMFVHGRPGKHMVCEATHFCTTSFLRNQYTKEIWN